MGQSRVSLLQPCNLGATSPAHRGDRLVPTFHIRGRVLGTQAVTVSLNRLSICETPLSGEVAHGEWLGNPPIRIDQFFFVLPSMPKVYLASHSRDGRFDLPFQDASGDERFRRL